MKKKFRFSIIIVIALMLLLAPVASAKKPVPLPVEQEFIDLGGGEFGIKMSTIAAPPDIHYDCRPYVTVMGCHDGYPGRECYNGFTLRTHLLGVGCGMVVYFYDQYGVEQMIDFEETVDYDGYSGIAGWRTGYTASGNAVRKGYLGTFLFSQYDAPFLPQIFWNSRVIAPHRVDFRFDPETGTCHETGWCQW